MPCKQLSYKIYKCCINIVKYKLHKEKCSSKMNDYNNGHFNHVKYACSIFSTIKLIHFWINFD